MTFFLKIYLCCETLDSTTFFPQSLPAHRQLAENQLASRQTVALPSVHVRPLTLHPVKCKWKQARCRCRQTLGCQSKRGGKKNTKRTEENGPCVPPHPPSRKGGMFCYWPFSWLWAASQERLWWVRRRCSQGGMTQDSCLSWYSACWSWLLQGGDGDLLPHRHFTVLWWVVAKTPVLWHDSEDIRRAVVQTHQGGLVLLWGGF